MSPVPKKVIEHLIYLARNRSYAPHSQFPCASAIKALGSDEFFYGVNVENDAFPSGLCAEAGSVSAAITAGAHQWEYLVVFNEIKSTPLLPCGSCLQRLAQFAAPDFVVYSFQDKQRFKQFSLGQLAPELLRGLE